MALAHQIREADHAGRPGKRTTETRLSPYRAEESVLSADEVADARLVMAGIAVQLGATAADLDAVLGAITPEEVEP